MAWNIEQNYYSYIQPSIQSWLDDLEEPAKAFTSLVVECEFALTRYPTDLATTLTYIDRFTNRPEDMMGMVDTVVSIIRNRGSMTNGAHAFVIGNIEIPVCSEEFYQEYYGR